MKLWNNIWKRQPAPQPDGNIATRYSITHAIGQPQRLTLWGADQCLTLEIPDRMAQDISASLMLGVIDNRKLGKR